MTSDTTLGADGAADPLLLQACAWIGQLRSAGHELLPFPISRLQRQFRTGYTRACALAQDLEQRGDWTIGFAADGSRYARLECASTSATDRSTGCSA